MRYGSVCTGIVAEVVAQYRVNPDSHHTTGDRHGREPRQTAGAGMSTAPDLATRLRAWEDADEPRGFVVRLPLMSANKLWKPVVRRKMGYAVMVETTAYEEWKATAGKAMFLDFTEDPPKRITIDPVHGRVAVSIVLVPSRTSQDADNVVKPALDLLVAHGLIEGDTVKTVRRIEVEVWTAKQTAIPKGHMQVRVRGLPEAAE